MNLGNSQGNTSFSSFIRLFIVIWIISGKLDCENSHPILRDVLFWSSFMVSFDIVMGNILRFFYYSVILSKFLVNLSTLFFVLSNSDDCSTIAINTDLCSCRYEI